MSEAQRCPVCDASLKSLGDEKVTLTDGTQVVANAFECGNYHKVLVVGAELPEVEEGEEVTDPSHPPPKPTPY